MSNVNRDDVTNNAWALKVSLTESEIDYCVKEVNNFFNSRPQLDCEEVIEGCASLQPLRYVHSEIVNVFSTREESLISVDDILENTLDREGNYIKVPKVLK
ncbi:MAG: aspartyl/glutamyl-tRNA amidotransferase subunit C [Bacilli bacterium]